MVAIVRDMVMVCEPPSSPSEDSTELHWEGWTGSAGGGAVRVGLGWVGLGGGPLA